MSIKHIVFQVFTLHHKAHVFILICTKGASSIVYLATKNDDGITREYFVDCKQAKSSSYSKNLEEAQKLWDLSERLVNEEFPI